MYKIPLVVAAVESRGDPVVLARLADDIKRPAGVMGDGLASALSMQRTYASSLDEENGGAGGQPKGSTVADRWHSLVCHQ